MQKRREKGFSPQEFGLRRVHQHPPRLQGGLSNRRQLPGQKYGCPHSIRESDPWAGASWPSECPRRGGGRRRWKDMQEKKAAAWALKEMEAKDVRERREREREER